MSKEQYRLEYAVMLWNWHTRPSALRSDWEHFIHRKAARRIYRWIERSYVRSNWGETESGRLVAYNSVN